MRSRYFIGFIVLLIMLPATSGASQFVRAVESRQWAWAEKLAGDDRSLRVYAQWRRLKDFDSAAEYEEIAAFIDRHPMWPDHNILRQRAEKLLFVEQRREQSRAFLKKHPPISGYGKLAQARIEPKRAAALVKDAWVNGDFDAPDERKILAEFGGLLNPNDHLARIERLLKDDRATIAERHLARVTPELQQLFRARIALIRSDPGVDGKVKAVASRLQSDHGFVADRIRWRDRKGMKQGALDLLRRMRPDSPYAQKLWPMRAWHVREFIETRQFAKALQLLEGAGTLEGAPLADMLWLKGWIYLEHTGSPAKAYEAFKALYQSVQFPVSRSRGAYWAARAAETLGRPEEAKDWYRKAAQYPTVFYGQLAYQHLYPKRSLRFPEPPATVQAVIDRYAGSTVFIAAKRLTAFGAHGLADQLISHLAEDADAPGEAAALVKACAQSGLPLAQVRAIKGALKQNVLLVKEGWPTVKINVAMPVELPLAFAISRQESEFNPKAVSPAGARGLMQIMVPTGRIVARQMRLPFSPERLFEPDYNLKLGGWYLGSLIDRFRGSYIMAIAGYNAGPGRPKQWAERFGRPGDDLRRTINWIETIPFAETRNYVQRVLENLQVYRAVLNPDQPLLIEADLLR